MTDSLSRRATVRELVAAFQAAEAQVRSSFAALVQAERDVNAVFGISDRSIRISASDHWGSRFDDPDAAVKLMARDAWVVIVDRLELRRAMSIKRYEALDRQIREGKDLPPITEETVMGFVQQSAADLSTMFEEAVLEVHAWLRPRGSKYKSNSEYEIPAKVVLERVVDPIDRWPTKTFRVNYHVRQTLIALENVFNGLDGRGQIAKDHYSVLQRAIEACPREVGRGETELFSFRAFGNGNLHLAFKRLDLLARLNQIAGGKRLRSEAA